VLGQVVTQVTHGGESYAKLSVNNFPDGMYTLRIHSEKGLVQKQIMVSR
jgi:hypothetical protein